LFSITIAHFVPIRYQTWTPQAIFVLIGRFKQIFFSETLGRGTYIDASYQDSVHLAKWFQRRFSLIDQSETRIAYGSHVC
jgi:hypothetical protein